MAKLHSVWAENCIFVKFASVFLNLYFIKLNTTQILFVF